MQEVLGASYFIFKFAADKIRLVYSLPERIFGYKVRSIPQVWRFVVVFLFFIA